MVVRVPTIEPIQSTGSLPKNERIRGTVQSGAGDILNTTKSISSLVNTADQVYTNYEDDKINQISNELKIKASEWNTIALQDLKQIKGDPTDAYVEYDKAEQDKYKDLLAEYPDVSGRVKENIQSNLAKVQQSYKMKTLKQRGAQEKTYRHNLHVTTLRLDKRNLGDQAANVTKDGKSDYDLTLKNITDEITKNGLENGTVKKLPDNAKQFDHAYIGPDNKLIKVSFTPISKLKIAQERGEGVAASINAVLDSGETEQAKIVYDKYKQYLDFKSESKILDKFEKSKVSNEAHKLVSEIETKSKIEQDKALAKTDSKTRSKTLQIMSANATHRANLKKRQEDINGDKFHERMEQMEKAGRLNGEADIEADPVLRGLWDQLSPDMKKSVKKTFNAPKDSHPESLLAVQEFLLSGDVAGTSAGQFQAKTARLSKGDKNKMWTEFRRQKSLGDSLSATSKVNNEAAKMLKGKMINDGLIELNDFGKPEDEGDYVKLNQANQFLMSYLERVPPNTPANELNKHVDNFVKEMKHKDLFGDQYKRGKYPVFKAITKADKLANKNALNGLSTKEIRDFQIEYEKIDGDFPETTNEAFLNYVRSNK